MALGPQRPWMTAPVSDRALKCLQCSLPCAEASDWGVYPSSLQNFAVSHTANKANSGLACGTRRGMWLNLGYRYKTAGDGVVFTSSLSLRKY